MFTVTKNARIHKSVAAESFSTAEVTGMKLETGSNYYVWPFAVSVIGCGNTAPADFDPNGRNRFKLADSYTVDEMCSDLRELYETHGSKLIVNSINRGLDLELRAKARPNPKAKMSDADKCQWVITNVPAKDWAGLKPADFVSLFDARNA